MYLDLLLIILGSFERIPWPIGRLSGAYRAIGLGVVVSSSKDTDDARSPPSMSAKRTPASYLVGFFFFSPGSALLMISRRTSLAGRLEFILEIAVRDLVIFTAGGDMLSETNNCCHMSAPF